MRSFLGCWKGSSHGQDLDLALRALHERGRTAWPGVIVSVMDFAGFLGERAATDVEAGLALGRLQVEDLYLACGCALGDPQAMATFDEHFLARLPDYLATLRLAETTLDEVRQLLRQKLFVSDQTTPAKIRTYQGRGALESWVRMAAMRTALNLLASEKLHTSLDDEQDLVAPGDDPELDYLKARYRLAFSTALRRAFEQLPERDRNLLRFQYLDRLTPQRIGSLYGVHRTTALRWLAAAQENLFVETRRRLGHDLGVSPEECDSLLGLVRSRLDVTLRSLFRTAAP